MKTRIVAVLLLVLGLLAIGSGAFAQTVITNPSEYKIAWEAGDNWSTVGVNGFAVQVDSQTPIDLGILTPNAQGTYTSPVPPMTPGTHTLAVYAYNNDGPGAASVLVVRLVIFLDPAKGLRIIQVVQ